jgi:hypothetical protein
VEVPGFVAIDGPSHQVHWSEEVADWAQDEAALVVHKACESFTFLFFPVLPLLQ